MTPQPTGSVQSVHRPSPLWRVSAAVLLLAGFAAALVAWQISEDATRLVGEGELLIEQSRIVAETVDGADIADRDVVIRTLRNELEVEAITVLSATATAVVSTSETLLGWVPSNSILRSSVNNTPAADGTFYGGRFGAVGGPVGTDILVDGVAHRPAGAVLYQAAHPLSSGGAVVVAYDVDDLLSKRTRLSGVPVESVRLLGAAAVLALAGLVALVGGNRAARLYETMNLEARLLRERADLLGEHNRELQEARRRAEEARELAEEKNRIRAEFVLMINHELRTPLTAVISGAQLLRETAEDELSIGILDDMTAGGRRLETMLGQMLAVARVENRGLFVERTDVKLRTIVDSLRQTLTRVRLAGDRELLSTTIRSDATTLPQLIASLSDNSFQHGASEVVVSWRLDLPGVPMHEVGRRPDDALYILVADDGPGIDLDFLPRAFEKFEKRSFSSGTGLGLYMARMMVEALDGSLSVFTSANGTIMVVAVPLVAAQETVGVGQ